MKNPGAGIVVQAGALGVSVPARASLSSPARQASGRADNCFDFLRLFAALAVVVAHAVEHLKLSVLWLEPGGTGWFFDGVPLFFILSGFLVYRSCEKCFARNLPVRAFYLNRYLRIAPALAFYALLTPLLLLAVGALSWRALRTLPFWAWFASNFALTPVYYPDVFRSIGVGVLNGSLWTIPVECSFYLVVPLIWVAQQRRGFRFTVGLLAAASLGSSGLVWAWQIFGLDPLPMKLFKITFLPHLLFFALGIFWSGVWERTAQHGALCAGALAWYAAVRYELCFSKEALGPLWAFAWGLPLSYVVLWFGYHGSAVLRQITRVGDLSYGVYVWHMVVVNLMIFLGLPSRLGGSGALTLLTVLAATLGMALLSWWAIERPFLQLKPFTSKEPACPVSHAPSGRPEGVVCERS